MSYLLENGLRKVIPYNFLFKTHAKPRWIGKTLIEIFTLEFGETEEMVREDIHNKLIYVYANHGKKDGPILTDGIEELELRLTDRCDFIYNSKHMHEPSVPLNTDLVDYGMSIGIVYQDENLLVVNKPSGIPTHPTGNYFYNTVTEIVKHDLSLENVWPCHRLDKVTSGVLILGKTKEVGKYYQELIQNKKQDILKEYVTRVEGEFPIEEVMVNCPIFSVNSTGGYIKPLNADMLPVNSTTIFKRVKYSNELNQSIVVCTPLTGRMHQIRIHLRNMGFPIVNDNMYNPVNVTMMNYEINKLNNKIEMEIYRRIFKVHPRFSQFQPTNKEIIQNQATIDVFELSQWKTDQEFLEWTALLRKMRQEMFNQLKLDNHTVCADCNRELFDTDKDMSDLYIWLHAFRYVYPGCERIFDFTTEYPKWCEIA